MSSWDYYCVFCGATFYPADCISRSPRSKRFLRRRRQQERREQEEQQQQQHQGAGAATTTDRGLDGGNDDDADDADDDDDDDANSVESRMEEQTYDPAILSQRDAFWAADCQCVGLNPRAKGVSKAFLTAIGFPDDHGGFESSSGLDDNFPGGNDTYFLAYQGHRNANPVFPFHELCFTVFKQVLSYETRTNYCNSSGTGDGHASDAIAAAKGPRAYVDMDLLYSIFKQHSGLRDRLAIDYKEPKLPSGRLWVAHAGEELFLANPLPKVDAVVETIRNAWEQSRTLHAQPANGTASEFCRDILESLPMELLGMITNALQPSDIVRLISSSRSMRSLAVGKSSYSGFWIGLFRDTMPWFPEITQFLAQIDESEKTAHAMFLLFTWADKKTTPRAEMRGPLMNIANRRRIWGICAQLTAVYRAQTHNQNIEGGNTTSLAITSEDSK